MKFKFRPSLVLLLIAWLSADCYAQDESHVGVFVALPVGSFKSTDLEEGGFAKTGWGLAFDSKSNIKFLSDHWKLYFHSTYQWNHMDNQKVSEAFTRALGSRTVAAPSRYSPLLFTLGPTYEFYITEGLQIGLNSGLGVLFNNTRAFKITVYAENDDILVSETVNFDNNPAFAYLLGAEIKFSIVKKLLSGSLYADYTSAKQKSKLEFRTADPINSFQKLQYLNCGFRFIIYKK